MLLLDEVKLRDYVITWVTWSWTKNLKCAQAHSKLPSNKLHVFRMFKVH